MVLVIVWTPASQLDRKNAERVHLCITEDLSGQAPSIGWKMSKVPLHFGQELSVQASELMLLSEQSEWFKMVQLQHLGKEQFCGSSPQIRSPKICQLTVVHISSLQMLCIFL